MAKTATLDLASFEEYLAFEETAPDKHELFRGRIYAMAGGSANHGEVIDSLAGLCRDALRNKPCRFMSDNRKLMVESMGLGYYPDGAIACPPNYLDRRRGTYDNPKVILEVLSPGTERFDRKGKADDYKTLPTLQDYVLIESETMRVEVYRRLDDDGWVQRVYLPDSIARIPSVGIDLSLDDLYENAVLDEESPTPLDTSDEA